MHTTLIRQPLHSIQEFSLHKTNPCSFSNITLEPLYTDGVSVSYVLTVSPTPLSESPVTAETTSTQITVSYNTPYNVTTRAVNCVYYIGLNSQEGQIVNLHESKPFLQYSGMHALMCSFSLMQLYHLLLLGGEHHQGT